MLVYGLFQNLCWVWKIWRKGKFVGFFLLCLSTAPPSTVASPPPLPLPHGHLLPAVMLFAPSVFAEASSERLFYPLCSHFSSCWKMCEIFSCPSDFLRFQS